MGKHWTMVIAVNCVHHIALNYLNNIITILAFTVLIPLAMGVRYFHRIEPSNRALVYLCAIWFAAELYSYLLRINNIGNAHVSYVLTGFEIYFYSLFYSQVCHDRYLGKMIGKVGYFGFLLPIADYLFIGTPLNTLSLLLEYVILTCFAIYLFYEIVTGRTSEKYSVINFTLLFYMLSSFPYFFAWEWLRSTNLDLLRALGNVHSIVHSICYQIMAFILWKSSLSYSVR